MTAEKLDVWNQWYLPMSVVIGDKNPVIGNYLYVYAQGDDGLTEESAAKIRQNHGGSPEEGNYTLDEDLLFNILFFAISQDGVGVKVFGLGQEDFEIGAEALQSMETTIEQVGMILALKTEQVDLEAFARLFKDETVYYSTPLGDTAEGDTKLYICTSAEDQKGYYPVFLTKEHLQEFFKLHQREAYMILEDNLQHFLEMLDSSEKLQELGVVIEPQLACFVELPSLFRIK